MVALFFDPIYSQLPLPEGHRFPTQKYQRLFDKLCAAGVSPATVMRPKPLPYETVKGALCADYVEAFVQGTLDAKALRRIGFPWSEQLVRRTFTAVAGTLLAGSESLKQGRAINLSGGYHHAFYNYGSGFCIINDLYLSALNLLQQPNIQQVLIFDCDVHQGDGTAALAQHNPAVATVSIHGEKNFPFVKQRSDWDEALPKGTDDDEYLDCVNTTLQGAIDRFKPDVVIYDAGADIHINDDLGHFEISLEGVYERDKTVFTLCDQQGLPVSAVIGGGYQRDIDALAEVHFQLLRAAGVVT